MVLAVEVVPTKAFKVLFQGLDVDGDVTDLIVNVMVSDCLAKQFPVAAVSKGGLEYMKVTDSPDEEVLEQWW